MPRSLLGVVFLLALVAPLGTAQEAAPVASDTAPVISAMMWNGRVVTQVPPGAVIILLGKGLPIGHPRGLSVTVEGRELRVLGSTLNSVTILLPFEVRPGPTTLRVEFGGQVAEASFELVDYLEAPAVVQAPVLGPSLEERILAQLAPTHIELVMIDGRWFLELEGEAGAALRDVFSMHAFLTLAGEQIDVPAAIRFQEGHWHGTLGPLEPTPAPRAYGVDMVLEVGKQPRMLARRIRARLAASGSTAERFMRRDVIVVAPEDVAAATLRGSLRRAMAWATDLGG